MQKAQAVLEYVMTYAWMFLIVIVILAALVAYGLTNPSTSSICLFESDFTCISYQLSTNGNFIVNIGQSTQSPINVTAIGCNDTTAVGYMRTFSRPTNLLIGTNFTTYAECYSNNTAYNAPIGTRYKGYLLLNYTNLQTNFKHTVTARLIVTVSTKVTATTTI